MFSITRKQLLDWPVGPDELDAIASVWLSWHEAAQAQRVRPFQGYHAVEARLLCIPRRDRDSLARRLQQRLNLVREIEAQVESPDLDSISVTTPFVEVARPCPLGRWLTLFADPAFAGLAVMLRLSVHDWRGPAVGPAVAGGTLVLVGVIEAGGLRIKAVWPAGLEPGPEGLYSKTAWLREADFVDAVEQMRRTGAGPPGGTEHFAPRPTQRWRNFIFNLYFHFLDQDRLSRFVGRAGTFLLGLVAVIALYFVVPFFLFKDALFGGVAAFFLTSFVFVVSRQARKVGSYYHTMTAGLKRVYSRSARFLEVDLAALGVAADPNAVKYARDLENTGLRHLGDVYHEPKGSATAYTRVFAVPGEPTFVLLNLMFATENLTMFPAKAFYLINTYLDEGRRVACGNEGGGFRKLLDPSATVRFMPEIDHPVDLLARHRQVVDRKLTEGCRFAPPMAVPALLARMESDHERHRERLARYGHYTWGAAFRQCFRLVRREYRD